MDRRICPQAQNRWQVGQWIRACPPEEVYAARIVLVSPVNQSLRNAHPEHAWISCTQKQSRIFLGAADLSGAQVMTVQSVDTEPSSADGIQVVKLVMDRQPSGLGSEPLTVPDAFPHIMQQQVERIPATLVKFAGDRDRYGFIEPPKHLERSTCDHACLTLICLCFMHIGSVACGLACVGWYECCLVLSDIMLDA